jgi:hypothetical protein
VSEDGVNGLIVCEFHALSSVSIVIHSITGLQLLNVGILFTVSLLIKVDIFLTYSVEFDKIYVQT